jgi:hypothetical protein
MAWSIPTEKKIPIQTERKFNLHSMPMLPRVFRQENYLMRALNPLVVNTKSKILRKAVISSLSLISLEEQGIL